MVFLHNVCSKRSKCTIVGYDGIKNVQKRLKNTKLDMELT